MNHHCTTAFRHGIFLLFFLFLSVALLAQPVITSFSPVSGPVGTTVTIKGNHFANESNQPVVYFGAVKGIVRSSTDTEIKVTVPVGATFAPLTVTAQNRTAYAAQPFQTLFTGAAAGFKLRSFSGKKDMAGYSFPRSVTTADFDGDGKTDMVVTNQTSGTASVLRNTSSLNEIQWAPKLELSMGADAFGVATGDFDGDGKTDLAVCNANSGNAGSVSVRRNTTQNGTISFSPNVTMDAGNGPHGIAIADLNADGKPDLVVTAGNSGIISIYENKCDAVGQLAFATPVTLASNLHSDQLIIGDIDNDGKPDLVTADFSGNSISVWRNSGMGNTVSFANADKFTAGNMPVGLCAADFNGDGKTDIAVANYNGHNLSVLINNSSPGAIAFEEKRDYATGKLPRSVTADDMDGDGKIDLIVSCDDPSAVSIFKNTTSSNGLSFADSVAYPTGYEPRDVSIADLDGDGKPDMIVPNLYTTVSVLHNLIDIPMMTSFQPAAAKKDSIVTIYGDNFSSAVTVTFGGLPAAFVIESDSVIKATIDTGATGAVQVTTPYGTKSLTGFRYILPTPVISSFTPATATVGTLVRIVGENLNKVESVYFGSVKSASFTVQSDTLLTAVVGMGGPGNIVVANRDAQDTAAGFSFLAPLPVIASFTPAVGEKGTTVTIRGKNLTWTTGVSFGNSDAAAFTVLTDSTLTATLGIGSTGLVGITNVFGKDTLGNFVYLPAKSIMAYPNPGIGFTTMAHPATNGSAQLQLVDVNGRAVKTIAITNQEVQTKVDLNNMQPGIYRMVWSDGKRTLSQSILVQ